MAIPKKDSSLVPWGANFDAKATLSPITYSLSAPQALSFHTNYVAYAAAYTAVANAREAGSRSKLLTETLSTARTNFLKVARELYGIVQGSNSVSDANKADIGVHVRKTNPTPIPPPDQGPVVSVVSTIGNTVQIRLRDAARPSRRARPAGAVGASVFSAVAATPPTTEAAWTFEGVTSKELVDVVFPAETAAGAKVWFTAFWFNNRKESSPAATPVGTNLPGGAAMGM